MDEVVGSAPAEAAPGSGWTPDWSNAVFSLGERDRRWGALRRLMAEAGVDLVVCLPCTNSHDRGQADARYITQLGENSDETTVAFPVEGEVTAWHSRGGAWPSSNWLADVRAAPRGSGGATVAGWIEEHPALRAATIAVAGLDCSPLAHVRAAEGEVNWRSVEMLKERFPAARFVSATPLLGAARWRKSAEEIAFLRRGTEIAEETMAAAARHARAGVAERHVFAQMMFANAEAGGSFTPMFGWASGPLGNPYHRLEQPSFRTLAAGDVLNLEVEGRWGGYIAQIDQTMIAGRAPPELRAAMALVVAAFDNVMAVLKPGARMRDLIAAGTLRGLGGRAETGLGLHGRGTGDDGPLLVAGRPELAEILNLVVEEGCAFCVKPSVTLDGKPDYCKWGDSVVVTATGAVRLGRRPPALIELI
jgi:Xaa-Pro aminopeptidase